MLCEETSAGCNCDDTAGYGCSLCLHCHQQKKFSTKYRELMLRWQLLFSSLDLCFYIMIHFKLMNISVSRTLLPCIVKPFNRCFPFTSISSWLLFCCKLPQIENLDPLVHRAIAAVSVVPDIRGNYDNSILVKFSAHVMVTFSVNSTSVLIAFLFGVCTSRPVWQDT